MATPARRRRKHATQTTHTWVWLGSVKQKQSATHTRDTRTRNTHTHTHTPHVWFGLYGAECTKVCMHTHETARCTRACAQGWDRFGKYAAVSQCQPDSATPTHKPPNTQDSRLDTGTHIGVYLGSHTGHTVTHGVHSHPYTNT